MTDHAISLTRFLKGTTNPKDGTPGCANYDHHYGGCLFGGCFVERGERCSYFERAVLPTGDSDVRQKYESLTGAYIEGIAKNLCSDCGCQVPTRRRYCDDCTRKRRRKTRRIYQQKFRNRQKVSA